jgi:hypothetical protein
MIANSLRSIFISLLLILAFSACQPSTEFDEPSSSQPIIENELQSDARVFVPDKETLVPINEVAGYNSNGRIITQPPEDLNYVLVLRAGLDAPQWEDQVLQASHVTVANGFAYITYNSQGDSFLGGLDVIDISNPLNPVLKAQAIFPKTEFSSVAVLENTIYLTGAQLDENNLVSPAIVKTMSFSDSKGLTEDGTLIDLPGYVGTDIKVDDQFIYVTHGTSGGLSIYNKSSFALHAMIPLDDARSVMLTDDQVMVMQGSPARVSVISKATWEVTRTYQTEGANEVGAKSIFDISEEDIYIPAGREGLKVLNQDQGTLKQQFELPNIEGTDPANVVSNAVTKNSDKLFVSNGAAGLFVFHLVDDNYQLFGSANFNASVNFVISQQNLMFVATGTQGLKIIEIVNYNPEVGEFITIGEWDEYGRPDYLCETESNINVELQARIDAVFSASNDITQQQPDWFGNSVVTDVSLLAETDIEITVISETTHHKNSIGYYTFDPETKPESPSDLKDMTIIFPNATVTSSGSHLMPGDKVCLNNFAANTQLGFFMVYKGFVDGQVTTGYKTHYSSQWLNKYREVKQQNIILADPEQQTLILAFEDVQRPFHDQDFDDGIFLIKFSNPNAVNWSAFLELPK